MSGLQALESKLACTPVAAVATFSSISSIVAPLGQPNYAAANASLCSWASSKAAQGGTQQDRYIGEPILFTLVMD